MEIVRKNSLDTQVDQAAERISTRRRNCSNTRLLFDRDLENILLMCDNRQIRWVPKDTKLRLAIIR